jgi:ATP-dependent Clp protease ATP-binding subunit ClpC
VIAGAKYRGEFEDRLKGVLEEIRKNKSLLLFLDEVHTLVGARAAEGAVDAANILKPALARGEIQLIGATTLREYRLHIEKDAALCRRFREVTVDEPSIDESIRILSGLRERYEAHHGLRISDEAIQSAVTLSARYLHERFLPDKAIDLIDEAAAEIRLAAAATDDGLREKERALRSVSAEKLRAISGEDFERAARLRDKEEALKCAIADEKEAHKQSAKEKLRTVEPRDVAAALASRTGLSVMYLSESEEQKLLRLEEMVGKSIVGQEEAVSAVCRAVRRGRVHIGDGRRPMGSFLFLGPSGVGKTALCRALAEVLFGSADALIRFDMSEYMEKHSVSRLIGAPPGYVGHGEGGQLTERVRRRPYAVVLWDEIEKAHPDVSNLLLQVMEDGVLTDSEGREVDFSNVLLILTSNIGARESAERHPLGFGAERKGLAQEARERALKEAFRPEFINRLDEIVVFHPLGEDALAEIARRMLSDLVKSAAERGVILRYTEELPAFLAAHCLRDGSGARPLRRALTRWIEDPLSLLLLEEKRTDGLSVAVELVGGTPRLRVLGDGE